eukprot:TRINITY_DN12568_c0_g1_i2.p2 TRINITY_DN12568_c0_g1~~TRINITY_DN12568_c0_g1_i2.p2  ORF type:complete len:146 (+),score=14.08 TRINITY_DN12568_c0_g1_i2:173-610(+)
MYVASASAICRRLKSQNAQISQLLARQATVKEIVVGSKERVAVSSLCGYYGKVVCKDKPIPFVIHLTVSQGLSNAHLHLSSVVPNPDKNHSEKTIQLNKQRQVVTLYSKGSVFTCNWIYMTLEAEEKAVIIFECNFGKSNSSHNQ